MRKKGELAPAMLNDSSNALIESTNTKIRVLQRIAFGSPARAPDHARPHRPWWLLPAAAGSFSACACAAFLTTGMVSPEA
jgi:hypothetical protein